LTVLADFAVPVEEFDLPMLDEFIRDSNKKIETLEQGAVLDKEIRRLDHFKLLGYRLHGTAMH